MTPDKIVAKFLAALDHFEPILNQPSDTDLTRLREAVAPLLLQILYDETDGTHILIGIIRAKPLEVVSPDPLGFEESFSVALEVSGLCPNDPNQTVCPACFAVRYLQ